MDKPSISYLTFNTRRNGGNKVIFEHVNRLRKKGYSIRLYSILGKQPDWFTLDVKIQSLFSFFKSSFTDIVVATFWPTAYIIFLLRVKHKFHFVQGWEEDFHTNIILKKLARYAIRLPLEKITISKFLERQINLYGNKTKPIHRIRHYEVDKSIFQPRRVSFNKESSKNIHILSVISRYKWYKGVDILHQIIVKLKKSYSNYDFTLVSNEQKPYSLIFDHFISNPSPHHLAKIYQNSDFLLVTSRTEGFFIPGLEAMATGCILVTTNCGGIEEYAKDKKNAVILKDIRDLWRKNIIESLMKNRKLKGEIIADGYKTVNCYKWKNSIEDLEKIYLGQNLSKSF